jgi:large subunit ribosomal protein L31
MTHHPGLHLIDVRCTSCGTSFTTRSTATKLSVDVCSACHPAYTGREYGAVRSDRIDRFNQRLALATAEGTRRLPRRPEPVSGPR